METKRTFAINPLVKIIFSFVILILAGSLLLQLPAATRKPVPYIDTLFTATSAVCVTGLIVNDVPRVFTGFGQSIILVLIQLGGLGVMTFSATLLFLLGGKISVRWQFAFMDLYSSQAKVPVHRLLSRMFIYTLTIETLGAALLFPAFLKRRGNALQALWDAVFHSVSAFCNAGFSTFSDSLISFNKDPYVLGVICMNIVLGGLGFFVILELIRNGRIWLAGLRRERPRITFSLHTRIVLMVTAMLILCGAALLYHLEADRTFARMGLIDRAANALFHSITCRTAGFNAVDIGMMKETSLFVMIVLMFIGGSPGSIAGGVKTTTFWIVLCLIWSKFRGHSEVILWKRTIDNDNTEKSATLVILALIFVSLTTFLLMYFNAFKVRNVFLASLYEITSAFGTVGLSTGITPQMSVAGKIITCIVMLTGRLGPLTLFASMTFNKKRMMLQYPKENIMVG